MGLRDEIRKQVRKLLTKSDDPTAEIPRGAPRRMAKALGVSAGFISRFIDGTRDISVGTLERIVEVYDVKPRVLIGDGEIGDPAPRDQDTVDLLRLWKDVRTLEGRDAVLRVAKSHVGRVESPGSSGPQHEPRPARSVPAPGRRPRKPAPTPKGTRRRRRP